MHSTARRSAGAGRLSPRQVAHLHPLADGAVVGGAVNEPIADAAGQQAAEEAANLHAAHTHRRRARIGNALRLESAQ